MEEELSLATFEPSHAQPPYLNTPRSLEACHRIGITPVELVAVPFEEFRKSFPNDPDAALRRFERIDGARRRLYTAVLAEWDRLCESGWTGKVKRPDSAKEVIIDVEPELRSTMLELQAEKFRKIEISQWKDLQRTLFLEVKAAFRERKNKEIMAAQQEIGDRNDDVKKQRQKIKEDIHKQQVEDNKRKEEQRALEVKEAQERESFESRRKLEQEAQNRIRERKFREQREMDRRKREEYNKQTKEQLKVDMRIWIEEREKIQAKEDQEALDRLRSVKELEKMQLKVKGKQQAQRIEMAQEQVELKARQKAESIKKALDEGERKMQKILTDKKKDVIGKSEELQEKVLRARQRGEEMVSQKINRTQAELDIKDALAKQELERLKAQQERRKNIKLIRQEAYELSANRWGLVDVTPILHSPSVTFFLQIFLSSAHMHTHTHAHTFTYCVTHIQLRTYVRVTCCIPQYTVTNIRTCNMLHTS